jgi:hypothetical protein
LEKERERRGYGVRVVRVEWAGRLIGLRDIEWLFLPAGLRVLAMVALKRELYLGGFLELERRREGIRSCGMRLILAVRRDEEICSIVTALWVFPLVSLLAFASGRGSKWGTQMK